MADAAILVTGSPRVAAEIMKSGRIQLVFRTGRCGSRAGVIMTPVVAARAKRALDKALEPDDGKA